MTRGRRLLNLPSLLSTRSREAEAGVAQSGMDGSEFFRLLEFCRGCGELLVFCLFFGVGPIGGNFVVLGGVESLDSFSKFSSLSSPNILSLFVPPPRLLFFKKKENSSSNGQGDDDRDDEVEL